MLDPVPARRPGTPGVAAHVAACAGTSRTSATTRSCGWSASSPARRPPTRSTTTSTTRSSTRAASATSLPILDPAGAARVRRRCAQSARSTCSTASTSTRRRPLLADGFVYGMVVQHEHQHDETMLATIQLMDDFAHPDADGRARTPTSSIPTERPTLAPTCCVAGGTFMMGTDDRAVGLRQRAPGARGDARAVPHRHHAGHQPRVRRVRRRRRLRRRPPLDRRRVGVAPRRRRSSRRSSGGPTATAAGSRDGSGASRTSRSTSPCSTSAGTRPTRSPAGPAPACRPRRSGSAPPRARGPRTANLWRRRRRTGSGPTPVGRRPGRRASTLGCCTRCSATSGSGRRPTSSGTPASGRSPTASTPRCSSEPSTRCCAAGRGRRTRSRCARTFRNWDYPIRRQIFAGFRCAARRLTRLTPVCRHLAYLGPPVALRALLFDAPHSLCEQARAAAPPAHRAREQADGWGVGWYDADGASTSATTAPSTPMWDDTRVRRIGDAESGAFVAAARLASPGATSSDAATRRSVADGWLFSLNGFVDGLPRGRRRRAARPGRATARRAAIVGRRRHRSGVRARARPPRRRRRPPPRSRHRRRRGARLATGQAQPAAHRRQTRVTAPGSATRCSLRPATIVSEPLDDDPDWQEVPDDSLVLRDGRRLPDAARLDRSL